MTNPLSTLLPKLRSAVAAMERLNYTDETAVLRSGLDWVSSDSGERRSLTAGDVRTLLVEVDALQREHNHPSAAHRDACPVCNPDRTVPQLNEAFRHSNELLARETAAALAHRACCGTEHDPPNGKLHGYCIVCGVPWPCETAQHYLRVTPEMPRTGKEAAWHAVWEELKKHHPKFFEVEGSGIECVIREIQRLQALDRAAADVSPVGKTVDPLAAERWICAECKTSNSLMNTRCSGCAAWRSLNGPL